MNNLLQESYTYNASTGNLTGKAGVTLTYTDGNHDHAVTGAGGNSYGYDSNGNQITRVVAGVTYTLGYDAENRMVSVSGGGMSASMIYDGDGKRVQSTINGVVTRFVGSFYEVSAGVVSKYYFLGGARVAFRRGASLYYPLGDHLGSTAVTTNTSGEKISELRYKPFGETRFESGTTPTEYKFTGQFSNELEFGLYFYNARWYDAAIGHFAQADSIVPVSTQGVQAYDRYAYSNNNPVRYSDPSGHRVTPGCGDGTESCGATEREKAQAEYQRQRDNYNNCWSGSGNYCSGFDKKIIKIDNLDLGTGTVQIGLGANVFRATGLRWDVSIALDGKLNLGFVSNFGAGGYTAVGGGFGPQVSTSNAPDLSYLEGYNVQVGGQVGEGKTVGFEYIFFKGKNREIYSGMSLSTSAEILAPFPGEIHGTGTYSHIIFQFNIIDLIIQPFRSDWIR